jgi:hypothetical protein
MEYGKSRVYELPPQTNFFSGSRCISTHNQNGMARLHPTCSDTEDSDTVQNGSLLVGTTYTPRPMRGVSVRS